MAKLPQYRQQVIQQQASVGATPINNSTGKMLTGITQGITGIAQIKSQMQAREARDYTITNQNQTTVALTEEKVRLTQDATTGTEYTDGIKNFISTQKELALDNAPSQTAADAISSYYDNLMAKELSGAIPVAAKMNAVNTAKAVNDSLEIGLNQTFRDPSDFEDSLERGSEVIMTSDIPENQKEAAVNEYKERLQTQKLLGTINQDPSKAVKEIESGAYDSIEPSKLNQLTSAAQNQVAAVEKQKSINAKKAEAQQKKEQDAENAKHQSNLEIGVSRGEMGYVEIERAYESGVITPEKRTQLTKQVDNQVDALEKTNTALFHVSAAIQGGQPLDYHTPEHQKAVDIYYANLDDEQKGSIDSVVNLVKNTKVIPSQVNTAITAGLKGDTEQKVSAANMVSRIRNVAPDVLAALPQDARAMGVQIARLVAAGVEQGKAVELAENSIYHTTKEQKEVLKAQLTTKDMVSKRSSGFNDAVSEISPSFFKPDRSPTMDKMEAEFNLAVNDYYMLTHDMESSVKLATSDVGGVWGSTWADGEERMMKYSPEKIYSNGDETPWIYNQVKSELKDIGYEGKYRLEADFITAREQKPSYVIMTEQDGAMMPLMIDGVIQRYTPDFSITEEAKKIEEEKADAMKRAEMAEQIIRSPREIGAFGYGRQR